MKRYLPVLYFILLIFTSCKEADEPSPYNLNGLWEGSHTLIKTAGENCEAEINADQFRMVWRVDRLDTVTVTEQEFSDFSKRWYNLTTTWRGAVTSDSLVRVTKYYEGRCITDAVPDSVVFRGNVRIENGFLVLNLQGEELRCAAAGPQDTVDIECTYLSSYQIRKRVEE